MLEAVGVTHPGRVRPHNEDGLLIDLPLGLFAVADGMGGHNAGEVACALALEALHDFIDRSRQDPDYTWPFGIESSLDLNGNRLRTAIKLANRRVYQESERRRQYTGMGTTVVALLVDGSCAAFCGVGDSRIYAVRRNGIELLTRDHTWLQMLLAQNPGINPQLVENHPMRHVLTSVVGTQDDVEVTVTVRPALARDRFVLCSDGVHGTLAEHDIWRIACDAPDARTAAGTLVSRALERDGRDNLTAVVVAVTE